jgi:hypothetical protein
MDYITHYIFKLELRRHALGGLVLHWLGRSGVEGRERAAQVHAQRRGHHRQAHQATK